MTTNPFYNAGLAALYITCVVFTINYGSRWAENGPENLLMPIGMLSLFVLSVAVMAYMFFYQPIIMFLDGKRKEALHFFLQTISVFAGITLLVLVVSLVIAR